MEDTPVIAAFRECGCFVCEFALVVEGHHQNVEFDTANWPAFGWDTRIVASSQLADCRRNCPQCEGRPDLMFNERWDRLSQRRIAVMDAIQVMRRLTQK